MSQTRHKSLMCRFEHQLMSQTRHKSFMCRFVRFPRLLDHIQIYSVPNIWLSNIIPRLNRSKTQLET